MSVVPEAREASTVPVPEAREGHIVAVSPHLDDAALSASVALSAGGVTVATVFTAVPAADWPVSWWDRLTGATSSVQRQRDRLAEDAAAMTLLSAKAVHLDAAEAQYRGGDPDLGPATERLTDLLAEAGEVWLPSAIGGHPDHAFARDAGLRAAAAAGHRQVRLYADFPYVIAYGWPDWVTRLSPPQRDLKKEVIAAYQSQAAALKLAPDDLAAEPAKLDFELAWRMPLT